MQRVGVEFLTTMTPPNTQDSLSERGLRWQVASFTVAGIISLVVLEWTEHFTPKWIYSAFQTATKDLYWLFIPGLAGVTEGARKMFEKRSAIREQAKQQALAKERNKERMRIQKMLLSHRDQKTGDITLSAEETEKIFA